MAHHGLMNVAVAKLHCTRQIRQRPPVAWLVTPCWCNAAAAVAAGFRQQTPLHAPLGASGFSTRAPACAAGTPMDAPAEATEQRDWLALPTALQQNIFHLASTALSPGTCVVRPVCHAWRSAAEQCKGIRLLYHGGHTAADQSLATWLQRNSWQLEALTISCSSYDSIQVVLTSLAEAAAAASAAGRPLRLHTLRVLQGRVSVRTAGQLVAFLPKLRCLQLGLIILCQDGTPAAHVHGDWVLEHLAPLQHTQLEELHLKNPSPWCMLPGSSLAGLFPTSLKRLSWEPALDMIRQSFDLSSLTQLEFLQLQGCSSRALRSSKLPPGLQQLELTCMSSRMDFRVLKNQQQRVTRWDIDNLQHRKVQQQLPLLPNLTAVRVYAPDLRSTAAQAALKQVSLSALTVHMECLDYHTVYNMLPDMQAAVETAASMQGLGRLHVHFDYMSAPPAFLGLAEMLVSSEQPAGSAGQLQHPQQQQEQLCAFVEALGRMAGLRWLSVPDVVLTGGWAWLGGLQQLRVLVVHCKDELLTPVSTIPWVQGCSQEALPPRLQVLGVSGVAAEHGVAGQLRCRLQRLLGSSSGCEVVVGPDLDAVGDPTQQLAGLPAVLQQALALG